MESILHSSIFWTVKAQDSGIKSKVSIYDHELEESSMTEPDLWGNVSLQYDAWILVIFTKISLSVVLPSCSDHRKQGRYSIVIN